MSGKGSSRPSSAIPASDVNHGATKGATESTASWNNQKTSVTFRSSTASFETGTRSKSANSTSEWRVVIMSMRTPELYTGVGISIASPGLLAGSCKSQHQVTNRTSEV